MKKLMFSAALLLLAVYAIADNVTLAWDPSTDPTVVGYNVYTGSQSRTYTNSTDAAADTSITISNLVPGVTYYFAATAYTAAGLESDFSAEASYTVPGGSAGGGLAAPTGFVYLWNGN